MSNVKEYTSVVCSHCGETIVLAQRDLPFVCPYCKTNRPDFYDDEIFASLDEVSKEHLR